MNDSPQPTSYANCFSIAGWIKFFSSEIDDICRNDIESYPHPIIGIAERPETLDPDVPGARRYKKSTWSKPRG
jgi:hypothetical protein